MEGLALSHPYQAFQQLQVMVNKLFGDKSKWANRVIAVLYLQ